MEIIDNKVVLGTRECHCVRSTAGTGKAWNIKYCQNYTKAQGTHNCILKKCPNNPSGKREWHELSRYIVTCSGCGGAGKVEENYCDTLTLPENFPIRVQRVGRGNTFNENYLGMGCLYSSMDYGEAAKKTDKEVEALVRANRSTLQTQAVKVVKSKDNLTLCDFLLVNVTANGYSVRAGFID